MASVPGNAPNVTAWRRPDTGVCGATGTSHAMPLGMASRSL